MFPSPFGEKRASMISRLNTKLGPVHTGTQSFHFVPYFSEKWNAEG